MSTKRRQSLVATANELRLQTISKILKTDSSQKGKRKSDTLNKQLSKVALSELIAATPSKAPPDFKLFLSDSTNVEEFRQFLKTQYCQENIDFYLACEKYRKLKIGTDRVSKELITFMATQIYNDFLSENAKQPINIDYECLNRIKQLRRNPTSDMFNDAQLEIFNLMRSDCFPRFCKTWRVDRNTARRILSESFMNASTRSTSLHTNQESYLHLHADTTSLTNDSASPAHSGSVRTSPRAAKQNIASLSYRSQTCPSECPYSRTGLPCKHQKVDTSFASEECKLADLTGQAKPGRPNKQLRAFVRRTPPPPPLICTPITPPALPPRFQDKSKRLTPPELIKARNKPRLPTPPDLIKTRNRSKVPTPPAIHDKNCAYVGKVFHV